MVTVTKNGIVSFVAGDCVSIPLYLNRGTDYWPLRYILKDNAKIYFSIMEPNMDFNNGIVRKIFTSKDLNSEGNVVIKLAPEETELLHGGQYFYSIKLEIIVGNKSFIETVVPKRKLIIYDY